MAHILMPFASAVRRCIFDMTIDRFEFIDSIKPARGDCKIILFILSMSTLYGTTLSGVNLRSLEPFLAGCIDILFIVFLCLSSRYVP